MRVLLLLRGSPGAGKSTFIKENNLEQFTLSADDIRVMCGCMELQLDNSYSVSQSSNKQVWDILYNMLEQRMKQGALTVVDATHSTEKELKGYKNLVDKYRYRVYVVDFTDVPIEVSKERNLMRHKWEQVSEEVIDKFYKRFEGEKVPRDYIVIKPNELDDAIDYRNANANKYDKIHVIGDLHGSYTVLKEYLGGELDPNHLYIFCGDYTDRGVENVEVLQFLQEIYKKPNVILLEGNHDFYIRSWARNEENYSNSFATKTKPILNKAFEEGKLNKRKLRDVYRRMYQCYQFYYDGKIVTCTHGGVTYPINHMKLNTNQLINGVGKYEDCLEVYKTFENTTTDNHYQIHGHRNIDNLPIQNGRCFNLEGGVEHGGYLRIVTLDKDGFKTHEIKNNVWDKPPVLTEDNIVEVLRKNRYIKEKKFGNISSFNFTNQAFREGVWDEQTCKARGLFVNTDTNKIVARGYEKYWRSDEVGKNFNELANKLVYPLEGTVKENGFLGMISWDEEKQDLRFCTKSIMYTDGNSKAEKYVSMFREIFYEKCKDVEKLKDNFKHQGNVTLLFEVIDPVRDPHIVEYKERDVILLDIMLNTLENYKYPYEIIKNTAEEIGVTCKNKFDASFNNKEDLSLLYDLVTNTDPAFPIDTKEGYVIEDSTGYMVKLKTAWYSKWKWTRNIVEYIIQHGNYGKYNTLPDDLKQFVDWFMIYKDSHDVKDMNIIKLRKEFERGLYGF